MADGYAVHQVFGNLISNALRYAQDGKKIIVGRMSSKTALSSLCATSAPASLQTSAADLRAFLPRG